MKSTAKYVLVCLGVLPCLVHFVVYFFHRNKSVIDEDLAVWIRQYRLSYPRLLCFVYLFFWQREFRNLFYYRVKPWHYLLNIILPRYPNLWLLANYIGPGFFIQHGDGARINGERIGAYCWVNQQVTIGHSNRRDKPTIEDHVKILTGARVIGKVRVGARSIIGANAVIVKDVPPDCTVVGVYPAYIVRQDGERVRKVL